jgi:hypothetical protein
MGEQTRLNAGLLIKWFRARCNPDGIHMPAGIKEIKISGLLDAQAASAAVGYAVRHTVLEHFTSKEDGRRLYRLTGRLLPWERGPEDEISFDSLISAWGLPSVPLDLRVASCRRIEAMF